jgi:hypothetical protein
MILNRGTNNIGCINNVFLKNINSSDPSTGQGFLNIFVDRVFADISLGIKVSCFTIPPNFIFPDFTAEPQNLVLSIENFAKEINDENPHRIIFYLPSYFFLGSQKSEVVRETKRELIKISHFLDLLGISSRSICLRIGTAYSNRKETARRFSMVVNSLPQNVKKLITVCNDEKPSLFSVTDLLSGVYYDCGIPITFRSLSHSFNSGGLSFREALFLSVSTWELGQIPIMIHGEPDQIDENGLALSKEPSKFLSHRIPTFSLNLDCVIESPAGDESCVKYMMDYLSLKPKVISKISSK